MANLFQQHRPKDYDAAIAQIPVIDLGPYLRGESGALARLGAELRHACENVGFLYIRNHGVPQALVDRAFAESERFHALPLGEKMKLSLNEWNIGYLPMGASQQKHSTVHRNTKPNLNESFFVSYDRTPDHPDVKAGVPLRGMNKWPEGLPGFRETAMQYFHALNDLAQRMLPGFAVALDLEPDFFDRYFEGEPHCNLRFLHYPPQPNAGDDEFGTGPHTDNSFLTILARMEVPGLAIRLTSGEWVQPPLIPGTFLVNLGNIMKRLSNDRFLSTPHGVIVEGDKDRYSIAYFHSPNPTKVLECVPSCIGPDNPPRYEPKLYGDLVLEFYRANYFHQKPPEGKLNQYT